MWALTSTPVLGPLLVLLYGLTVAACLVIVIIAVISVIIITVIIIMIINSIIIRLKITWW